MVSKPWRIIPRPLMESVLNNHAQHHRVPQPLILHGPRGVGKTTLLLERLLSEWSKGPHLAGYVDFAESIKDHHPQFNQSFPWASWSNCPSPTLSDCRNKLEECLESMAHMGVKLGTISSHQIFSTLNKWHGLNTALASVIGGNDKSKTKIAEKVSKSVLWDRAVFALSARCNAQEIDGVLGLNEKGKSLPIEESSYYREAIVALRLAKEVIRIQHGWRANAIAHLNQTGGFSRSLANSCTDWPCLLLELLSQAAEIDNFQPKLVINNIDALKNAILLPGESSVNASMYHDSLIWRIIALGANERSLPVILVTSDRLLAGLPKKLKYIWLLITSVIQRVMDEKGSSFEDIIDAYLAYLQITVVNPAMDRALALVQKFAVDAQSGKISKDKLRFGAPWRHPPQTDDPTLCFEWAKIQMMDFVQSLVNTEFGINYLADCSLEIFDDPSAVALLEIGLLYSQRDPSFIRPISKGIQRCLVRWLVQERMQMSSGNLLRYLWQRIMRGRSYRHLMLQEGYK